MHKFLRSIGFSDIKKKDLGEIITAIIRHPTTEKATTDSEGNEFVEIAKEFGDFFGITVRGVYREDDSFEIDHYYPYFFGKNISTYEAVEIEKHAEKESYAGICDEIRLGVTLIFYLQNVADYLAVKRNKGYRNLAEGVMLSALSVEGKILLPINKTEKQLRQTRQNRKERNQMIAAAREGDEDAIENLTLEDMDMYSLLSRRIRHEDILSIVDSYFMPHGIESDHYSVLGEIMDCKLLENEMTGEKVYAMELLCNDMSFGLCINQRDLLGEPRVGRRFKGIVWMQGSIKYKD